MRLLCFAVTEVNAWISLLRPHQWYKNLLCIVPLVIFSGPLGVEALKLVASFCLASSAVYILNDLADIESDRSTVDRRHRPLPSGQVSQTTAWLSIPLLCSLSYLTWLESFAFYWVALYWTINLLYSMVIKPHLGYGISSALAVLSCHGIRMMPATLEGDGVSLQDIGLVVSVCLTLLPLVFWKQRSDLFYRLKDTVIFKMTGIGGLSGLFLLVSLGVGPLVATGFWLASLTLLHRILRNQSTREPYLAILR